ncbi:MAG: hypothetical protein KIH63_001570 [Candidatus Saccharibacteria bacterium]|nr:hypothetical protein [Candidatus Saccharibacteria bacterium]
MEDNSSQPPTNTTPESESPQSFPNISPVQRSNRLKKPLIAIVSLLVAGGLGFGVWYALIKADPEPVQQTTNTASNKIGYISENQSGETKPSAIVYAGRKDDNSQYEIYRKPLDGSSKAVSVLKLSVDDYLTGYQAASQYVALSVEGKNGPSVWLSSDSGKMYQKVWSGNAGTGDALGEQITSLIFSHDQKRLLFAVYGTNGVNTVKELNLADTQIKDLFTSDKVGVFLTSYDSAKLELYYTTGCFNCDGNTGVPLYRRDLLANQETEVVTATNQYLLSVGVKQDGSELVYALGAISDEGLGAGPPYEIFVYDRAIGKATKLLEEADLYVWGTGYGDDGTGYYALGSKIYTLADKKVLFDAEKTIQRVGYLSKDLVITESGDYPNLQIASYNTSTKQATSLLSENANTSFIGVVEE